MSALFPGMCLGDAGEATPEWCAEHGCASCSAQVAEQSEVRRRRFNEWSAHESRRRSAQIADAKGRSEIRIELERGRDILRSRPK